MAHRCEETERLNILQRKVRDLGLMPEPGLRPAVWLFLLPQGRGLEDVQRSEEWFSAIRTFARQSHPDTVIAVLTTPPDAAALWPQVENLLRFQLWVAVRLQRPLDRPGEIPQHHAALLVLTRYRSPLRHTKMRIAYTYCPACDKTTKDYGGKKHTYHEYGTLVSDVWRDIAFDPSAFPTEIVDRIGDLFGLAPYADLNVVDLRSCSTLQPAKVQSATGCSPPHSVPARLDSALINEDCLKALGGLPSESVDLCFADPPYNLQKKYDNWSDALDVRRYFEWCDSWLGEMARVLKPGRTCAVLNIPLWAIRHFTYLKINLRFQTWIVWEGLGLPVRMVMPAHYSIICFSKGTPAAPPGLARRERSPVEKEALRPLAESYCLRALCLAKRNARGVTDRTNVTDLWWDIHRLKHNSRRVDHPCQLPPALMRRLIALFTAEGETVLDPFNGAGTTTLTAAQLNRRYIGIELSKSYHDLAVKRHAELEQGLDPFAKNEHVPKAKNSHVKRLEKQRYAVPKKVLQLEVKRIAQQLGHLPSKEEVERLSRYPLSYYLSYFISWGEVCAAARTTGMTEDRPEQRRKRRQFKLFEPAS